MKITFSIYDILCATLIILKALELISMSWFWVLSFIWIPLAIAGAVIVITVIIGIIGGIISFIMEKRNDRRFRNACSFDIRSSRGH